jgi:hypothetical protein
MQDRAGLCRRDPNTQVAAALGAHPDAVSTWRNRLITRRLDGLIDGGRPGRPLSIAVEQVEAVWWPRWRRLPTTPPLVAEAAGRQVGLSKSVQALEQDIRAWVADWNQHPRPFIWTKTAEETLESLARYRQRISGAGH